MKPSPSPIAEQWKYIYSIFPFIDLPFGILCVFLSQNWIVTLCMLPIFPLVASTILYFSNKHNFQPGYFVFLINGGVFVVFAYLSGHASPAWLMLINMTVGSCFLFRNPRVGQINLILYAIFMAWFYYFLGATLVYCITLGLILISFLILFGRAYAYMQMQQARIEDKNQELEVQQKEIISSIDYASKIQHAILPDEENIYRSIPLSFIYYKARDLVSGDFFWFHSINENSYIIVCADCTGHGVPGAFMTVIGSSLLNQIVIENKTGNPSEILSELDIRITETLKQQKDHYQIIQDGMDLSLLKVDKLNKEFIFTSAKRTGIFIRNKEIQELKGSKNTIGGLRSGEKTFNEIRMNFETDDIIYLFTDGYVDQFGGEENKKFMIKRFRELLLSIHQFPMQKQKQEIENNIVKWIGSNEQTDDILVMGIRF